MIEVVAPAGYGKTTLLAAWRHQLESRGLPVVHLSLEEIDRDPLRFLSRLKTVTAGRRADLAEATFDTEDAGLELVFSALAADSDPRVLCLDDVHVLKGSPSALTLQWLCDRQPDSLDLLLASRDSTVLQLQERLLRDELIRVDSGQLALTEDETRHVINDLHDLALTPKEIRLLHERTEGWPAAVRLAALALGNNRSRDQVLAEFAGSNRHVTDYLAETVLSNLDGDEVDFLMRVAVPERVDGALAAALTGRADSAAWLRRIEQRNLFLMPLHDNADAYRFHALFGEFLRTRLHERAPATWTECLAIAESWALEHGDYGAAIEYALRAREYDRAARLLAEHVNTLVHRRGQHTAVLDWIDRLPGRILARHPQIQIDYSWSLVFDNRYSESRNVLRRLRLEVETDDSAKRDELLAEIERAEELNEISQSGLSDHAEASVQLAEEWLARWPDAKDYQRGVAAVVLGYGRKTLCDFEGALTAAAQSRDHYAVAQSPYGVAWCDIVRVVTLIKAGRLRLAHAECLRSLEHCRRVLGPNTRSHGMLSAFRALLEYEFDDLSGSREALGHGARFLATQTSIDPIICCYTTLGLLYMHDGDPAAALEILHEGEQCGAWRQAPRLMTTMIAMRALIHLRCGDLQAAETLLDHDMLSPQSTPAEFQGVAIDKRRRLRVRIALASGKPQAALSEAAKALKHAQHTGQQRKTAELHLLMALGLQQRGQSEASDKALRKALLIGSEEGLRRVFLDEGESVRDLLEQYCVRQEPARDGRRTYTTVEWAQSLIGSDSEATRKSHTGATDEPQLLDNLTQRELQLLRLLDSGLSNKKLADNLFVTEGTVKWHLHNIYQKLGVRKRIDALNAARQLGLIR